MIGRLVARLFGRRPCRYGCGEYLHPANVARHEVLDHAWDSLP